MAVVLVIEDDALLRETLVGWLARLGHTTRTAANGRVGLDLYRAEGADIVLCDLVMPDKEGIETIRELRRDFPSLGIIAMSGGLSSGGVDYLKMAGQLGADELLSKPFRIGDLGAALERVMVLRV